ncbi:hypothetical protein BDN72DRAFT_865423 [Pluteus cervinus]|uniref:Uncharacterized protein n=1 Tax=Pluteus cervinus TaxID=181527 RepID=A0ACD3A0D2_9AGAR|nr:hypothetical protein BDN72DRAFT_865423 [Pluteus cervinus]
MRKVAGLVFGRCTKRQTMERVGEDSHSQVNFESELGAIKLIDAQIKANVPIRNGANGSTELVAAPPIPPFPPFPPIPFNFCKGRITTPRASHPACTALTRYRFSFSQLSLVLPYFPSPVLPFTCANPPALSVPFSLSGGLDWDERYEICLPGMVSTWTSEANTSSHHSTRDDDDMLLCDADQLLDDVACLVDPRMRSGRRRQLVLVAQLGLQATGTWHLDALMLLSTCDGRVAPSSRQFRTTTCIPPSTKSLTTPSSVVVLQRTERPRHPVLFPPNDHGTFPPLLTSSTNITPTLQITATTTSTVARPPTYLYHVDQANLCSFLGGLRLS